MTENKECHIFIDSTLTEMIDERILHMLVQIIEIRAAIQFVDLLVIGDTSWDIRHTSNVNHRSGVAEEFNFISTLSYRHRKVHADWRKIVTIDLFDVFFAFIIPGIHVELIVLILAVKLDNNVLSFKLARQADGRVSCLVVDGEVLADLFHDVLVVLINFLLSLSIN